MPPPDPDHYWNYSLELYRRPGVAEASLNLQDRRSANVNLLLLCCWMGSLGWRLSADDLRRLQAVIAPWETAAIEPLRAARRGLKGWPGPLADEVAAFRETLKARELVAEKIEQRLILMALSDPGLARPQQQGLHSENLEVYASMLEGGLTAADRADLAGLLSGALDLEAGAGRSPRPSV